MGFEVAHIVLSWGLGRLWLLREELGGCGEGSGVEVGRDGRGGFVDVGEAMREVDEVGGGVLGQCGRVF